MFSLRTMKLDVVLLDLIQIVLKLNKQRRRKRRVRRRLFKGDHEERGAGIRRRRTVRSSDVDRTAMDRSGPRYRPGPAKYRTAQKYQYRTSPTLLDRGTGGAALNYTHRCLSGL